MLVGQNYPLKKCWWVQNQDAFNTLVYGFISSELGNCGIIGWEIIDLCINQNFSKDAIFSWNSSFVVRTERQHS